MKVTEHQIKIETGIPIPQARSKRQGVICTMKDMKVGQSFLWRKGGIPNLHGYAARAGIRITTRRVGKGKRILHRVWRIE